jgi:hypothetical protein
MQVRGSSRENEKMMDKTYALKETNLTILSRLVLPTHSNRGSDSTPQSLCELLLYYKGSGPYTEPEFSPSNIMLKGYAASSLGRISNSDLMWLVGCQVGLRLMFSIDFI